MRENKVRIYKSYNTYTRKLYVRRYLESTYTIKEFSRINKLTPSTLSRWLNEFRDEIQKEIDEESGSNINTKEDSESKTITIPLQEYFDLKKIESAYNIICSVISR